MDNETANLIKDIIKEDGNKVGVFVGKSKLDKDDSINNIDFNINDDEHHINIEDNYLKEKNYSLNNQNELIPEKN